MNKNYFKIKAPYWLLIISSFLIWPIFGFSASNDVVVNEIAWMGTGTSANPANDEWLELYNNTDQDIDLTGWTLKAIDGTPEIILSGTIAANGYFLLERTDDETVPGIAADQIYTGALGNNGENLELRDEQNNLIDQVDCSSGWLAGDNTTKQTMERKNPQGSGNDSANWQNSQNPGGTPRAQNSPGQEIPPEQPPTGGTGGQVTATVVNEPPVAEAGPDITALVNQEIVFDASKSSDPDFDKLTFFWNFGDGATDTQGKTNHTYLYPGQYFVGLMASDSEFSDLDIITVNIYSQSIIISEFMPDPFGADEENEWLELFNQSDRVANLTGWQLDDQASASPAFIFPANSLIAPKQFLVLRRPIIKLTLNNDRDQVRLFYPDGSLASQVDYQAEKKQGFSVAFNGQDYFWTKIPTPGAANIISLVELEPKENLSSNNPQPAIQTTKEAPNVLAANLSQAQKFSASEPSSVQTSETQSFESADSLADQIENPSQQTASLVQTQQTTKSTSQKNSLILILSIIISGSLLVSWFLIRMRKKYQGY